ncbi:succinate--CoA ligase subunit beta [bacterium B13(2017)]|nr:succinate--CoA ligase subunit beta [bacterium B13(2017)]
MKIHEYQAAEIFNKYGIETVKAVLISSVDDLNNAIGKLGEKIVLKAQVLTGGRGKEGGVKLVNSKEEAIKTAKTLFSMKIKSIPVKKLLAVKAVSIIKEYYLGITIDRDLKKIVFIISEAGGIDIEDIAKTNSEKIYKYFLNPLKAPDKTKIQDLLVKVFKTTKLCEQALDVLLKLYQIFIDKDCSLIEINPFAINEHEKLIALDAKINFDDNAIFKHPEIEKLRSMEEYSEDEQKARKSNLSFVSMEGDIGCIVNGAGLAMATMDIIKHFGGEPANFLDVGGSSNPQKMIDALQIILSNKKVKAILINIFGGITRCDDIAKGIILAKETLKINIPLLIRLTGTNESIGIKLLNERNIFVTNNMKDAILKIINKK